MDDFEKQFSAFMGEEPTSRAADAAAPKVATEQDGTEIQRIGEPNKKKISEVSKEIDNKFSIVEKGGSRVYSYSNDPDKVAFTEKEDKLVANDKNPALIKSMIEVAESKGWENITVKGDKEFKQAVWLEAKARGLEVKGYEPTEQDERKLARILDKQNGIEQGEKDSPAAAGTTKESDNKVKEDKGQEDDKLPKEVNDKSNASIPPISDEGKELRAQQLKHAVVTMDKKDAIEKYPELENVYKVEPAAIAYYRAKGGIEEQEDDFKKKATEKAIEEVAAGRKIPDFDVSSYKTPETKATAKVPEKEIDFD